MADESRHTSGPWLWEREGNQLSAGKACNRTAVASIRHDRGFQYLSVGDPDRALIAAAPDMHAALLKCKWMLETLVKMGRLPASNAALCDAMQAIAKAEGRME